MKGYRIVAAVAVFVGAVLFPLFSMKNAKPPKTSGDIKTAIADDSFRVYLTGEKETVALSAEEYTLGVVLAEMPVEYEPEALKAQAVVAYTYAKYKSLARADKEYDVTDSHESDQEYLSESEARERFGENYEKYKEKVMSAVKAVKGEILTYGKEPILAVCHSISGGKTESAENVWGGDYPYLIPVESVGDILSSEYLSEVTLSDEQMRSALEALGIKADGSAETWLTDITHTESGYVDTLKICGTEVKGTAFRSAIGLKSANFDFTHSDGRFVFSVRGYGHGVGMSQYGAQFMALQGSSYREILEWYYTGVELSSVG